MKSASRFVHAAAVERARANVEDARDARAGDDGVVARGDPRAREPTRVVIRGLRSSSRSRADRRRQEGGDARAVPGSAPRARRLGVDPRTRARRVRGVGRAGRRAPPPPFDVPAAPPARLTAPEKLRARDVVAEVIRMAARDFFPASMLICVAGAAAQTLNLGGTFILAILNVHDVEIVAALFLLCVQFRNSAARIPPRSHTSATPGTSTPA